MNKIKTYIRNKLIRFLGIDLLHDNFNKHIENNINAFKSQTETIYNLNNSTRNDLTNQIQYFQDSVNVLHNTVENVVHIGTDVRQYNGSSWAVICIEGNMNVVKFVDLGRNDIREVLHFLKQFEAGKHCIDTPYKEMFNGELFKF